MNTVSALGKSSLGMKYVMAATGAVLFLFVVGHLVGNLQVFGPPELINGYAHCLNSKPLLLWGVRLGLLAVLTLHVVTAVQLTLRNKDARPIGYLGGEGYGSTWQSRYMLVSGLVILAFVAYHLAHFTALLPWVNGVGDFRKLEATLPGGVKAHDVYAMMILGFQVWWVVLLYLAAQALLFIHLGHGLAAMFQSVGLRDHNWWPRIQFFAKATSIAIFIGYALIPISIYMHVIGVEYADKVRDKITQSPSAKSAAPAVKGGEITWPR